MLASQRQAVRIGTAAETGERQRERSLVGRERERASLRDALARASRGERQVVVISGEAGIGKTALVTTFAHEARRAHARVLSGECFPAEASRSFGVFAGIATQLRRSLGSAEDLPDGLRDIQRLLSDEGASRAKPQDAHWMLYDAFARLLRALCLDDTVVISIDDVQWSDSASRDLLLHLVRKLKDFPLLFVMAYRRDAQLDDAFAAWLADLSRVQAIRPLDLGPLDRKSSSAVVRSVLSLDGPADRDFASTIHQRAEGNPLLIEELLRDLIATGALVRQDGEWFADTTDPMRAPPRSIADLVNARLGRLTADTRAVVRAAAVLGQSFTAEVLAQLIEKSPAALTAALREAVDARLIELDPRDRARFRFHHALVRDAVLASLLETERRGHHIAAARALEGSASAAEIAEHLQASGDHESAARAHVKAGFEAERLFAYGEALSHAERALELGCLEPDLGDLLLRVMPLAHTWASPKRGMAFAQRTKDFFERRGDQHNLGWALVWVGGMHDRVGEWDQRRIVRRQALEILEPLGESKELARALVGEANTANLERRTADALAIGERARAMAKRLDDAWGESFAEAALGLSLIQAGRSMEAEPHIRARLAAARRADTSATQMVNILGTVVTQLQEIPGTRAERERLRREAVDLGRRADSLSAAAMDQETELAFQTGDWDRLVELGDEIRSFDDETMWSKNLQMQSLWVQALRTGDAALFPAVEQLCATILARGNWGIPAVYGSSLSWAAQRFDRVLAYADPVLSRRFDAATQCITSIYALSAARLAGDAAAYERWAAPARAATGTLALAGRARRCFVLAEDAARQGDLGTAVARMYEAAAHWEDYDWYQPVEMDVRVRLAELLAQSGDSGAAQQELATAIAYWRSAGADWYLHGVIDRAQTFGLTAHAVRDEAQRASGLLSRREREVATLVARGLTNREIAQQLTLSIRTAESHVEQIRSKLGFRTRAQIASWVSRTYGTP